MHNCLKNTAVPSLYIVIRLVHSEWGIFSSHHKVVPVFQSVRIQHQQMLAVDKDVRIRLPEAD